MDQFYRGSDARELAGLIGPSVSRVKSRRDLQRITRRSAMKVLLGTAIMGCVPAYADTAQRSLTRGVNIPLWLDGPEDGAKRPSPNVLSLLRKIGFQTIRLPVDPDRFVADERTVDSALQELSSVVFELTGIGFTVTIDMHPMGRIGEALPSERWAEDDLARAWAQIASVAASTSPDQVFLELLNEPPLWQSRWLPLRGRLASIVRKACPQHTIIWGAGRFQTIRETLVCPPLDDTNSIVAVHYYVPVGFTHQCQSWGTSLRSDIGKLPFPADLTSPEVQKLLPTLNRKAADYLREQLEGGWSVENIDSDFGMLAAWARKTGAKVVLNEFAANGICTDGGSRIRWTRAVRIAAERNGIGWTYWEFDRGFGFMEGRSDPATIDWGIVEALFGADR